MLTRLRVWFADVSPGEWLVLALGEILLQRYSWLLDDAFVYFRYVDNLVLLGRGLVYNPGEFVEGFSSPAWCMFLVLFRWTGCPYWLGIRIVGAGVFVIVWAMLVSLNRRLSPSNLVGDTVNYPLIAVALTYGSSCYFTSGVEGPLVILIGVTFAMLVVSPQSRFLQLLVGLAPLIRPELAVPWSLLVAYLWLKNRTMPWMLVLSGILTSGAWTLFRVVYYADFLPNTYYLKSIQWYSQGFQYLWDALLPYQLISLAALFVLIGIRTRVVLRPRLIMIVLALSVLVYVVRIGGDVRHFRYFLFSFILLSCSTAGILEALLSRRSGYPQRAWVMGLVVAIAFFTVSGFPRQLQTHPLLKPRIRPKSRDYRISHRIHDAAVHRSKYTPAYTSTGAGIESIEAKKGHTLGGTGPRLPVLVTAICRTAYIHWDRRIIHSYGLTDAILARVDVPSVRAGHKEKLKPLAEDLASVEKSSSGSGDAVLDAIRHGSAPEWMVSNQDTLRILSRKIHNRHHFFENLRLCLTRVAKIEMPPKSPEKLGKGP